jgi:hypothetical protein
VREKERERGYGQLKPWSLKREYLVAVVAEGSGSAGPRGRQAVLML